jgi:hypothetical protein
MVIVSISLHHQQYDNFWEGGGEQATAKWTGAVTYIYIYIYMLHFIVLFSSGTPSIAAYSSLPRVG